MFWRRGLLLAILGFGVFFSVRLAVADREAERAERAVSIARSARFGPARIRLEQVLKQDTPKESIRWRVPNPRLWGDAIQVELHVSTSMVYVFTVHVEGKILTPVSPNSRTLVEACKAIPRPGS